MLTAMSVRVLLCLTLVTTVSSVFCGGMCECTAPTMTCNITLASEISPFPTTSGYTEIVVYGNQGIKSFPDDAFTSSWRIALLAIHNTNISTLYCTAFDRIKSYLTNLRLIDNQFREIPRCLIGQLTNLRQLVINDSPISFLSNGDFFSNSRLTELDLRRNKIQAIHAQAMKSMTLLKRLILRENRLAQLAIGQFAQLGSPTLDLLDLSHNEISILSENMLQGVSVGLKTLDISYNKIATTTWPETMQTLQSFNSLTEIVLSGNKIMKIEPEQFNRTFPNLQTLHVAECSLNDIPWEALQYIRRLNVSGNNIVQSDLNFFRSRLLCPSSFTNCLDDLIDLSNNRVIGIRVAREFVRSSKPLTIVAENSTLRSVFVYLNKVPPYASGRPQLNLRLNDNRISEPVKLYINPIPGRSSYTYNQAVTLSLSNNNFAHLQTPPLRVYVAPLDNLSIAEEIPTEDLLTRKIDLRELDLSGNGIQLIPSESHLVAQVLILRLNRNRISSLGRLHLTNAPSGYNRMEILELRQNRITSVDINTFEDLSKLKIVDLRDNGLISLPDLSSLRHFSYFTSLLLDGNPLKCVCDLAWIPATTYFYKKGRITGRCKSPSRLEGFHPLCYNFGEDNCNRLIPTFTDALWQNLYDICHSDQVVGVRNFRAEVRAATSIEVSWTTFGPGLIFGYMITHESVGETKQEIVVHQDSHNFSLHDLKPGVEYHICLTVLLPKPLVRSVRGPTYCLNSTTMTDNVSGAVVGLSVALSLLILLLVLISGGFIRYMRNARRGPDINLRQPTNTNNTITVREDYEFAGGRRQSDAAKDVQCPGRDRPTNPHDHSNNPYTSAAEMYIVPISGPGVNRPPKPPKPRGRKSSLVDEEIYEDITE